MSIIEKLNLLGKKVNKSFPEINSGGCCVFAVMVAKALRKHGKRPRIIVGGYANAPSLDVCEARNNVKNPGDHHEWHKSNIYFAHVGVEFTLKGKKFHYDSNGVKPAGEMLGQFNIYKGHMRVSDAAALANNPDSWNHMFDRKEIPHLREKVTQLLGVKE